MNPGGIIVVGSINMDLVVRVARMPRPGETVLGGQLFTSLGGKGANQAVAAARAAQGQVTFLAAVGDDSYGEQARAALAAEARLDLAWLKTSGGTATGVALITVDAAGENMISVASGANSLLTPADIDAVPAAAWQAARVYLASLEVPLATVARGLERAREFGLLTILNPAPVGDAASCRELLPLVDVLTPNEIEVAALLGDEGKEFSAVEAVTRLQSCGARQVVVTQGAAGCVIFADAGPLQVPALKVAAVDTTAAGDCFNGALSVALAEERSLEQAVRFAIVAAGLSVVRAGAISSLPRRGEILAVAATA